VTIPFGVAAVRIGLYALWPFGRTVVRRTDAGAGSAIGNVLWLVLCGWWLALGHLVSGVLLCVTLIGIPLGLANFKMIPVSLLPFGRDIVSLDHARQLGLQPLATVDDRAPRQRFPLLPRGGKRPSLPRESPPARRAAGRSMRGCGWPSSGAV